MRLRRLALFPGVALLLAAARLAAASDVLELTDDNFESRVSDTGSAGLMLLEFFAPWTYLLLTMMWTMKRMLKVPTTGETG
uniref:Thioredoxin domain-containing protein n=1 Tax=Rhinopithecus bieti TaxID=61621 RepID=A0A2K6K680_RHIBE